MSLDGYAADASGDFQWTAPGDDVFDFHVKRMGEVSAEILGRNTYRLMTYWDTDPESGEWSDAEREFALRWRAIDRVAVSSTLTTADLSSPEDTLVSRLTREEIGRIVASSDKEVEIFGPTTAADAIRAGLVTDYRFFIVPKIVGGGLRALPEGADLELRLIDGRKFANGVTYLHYRAGE